VFANGTDNSYKYTFFSPFYSTFCFLYVQLLSLNFAVASEASGCPQDFLGVS